MTLPEAVEIIKVSEVHNEDGTAMVRTGLNILGEGSNEDVLDLILIAAVQLALGNDIPEENVKKRISQMFDNMIYNH